MKKILLLALLGLASCGRSTNQESVNSPKEEHCIIMDNVLMCPDGSEIDIPEEDHPGVIEVIVEVVVDVTPEIEDDPDVHCERNNRNKRKCKRIKRRKK